MEPVGGAAVGPFEPPEAGIAAGRPPLEDPPAAWPAVLLLQAVPSTARAAAVATAIVCFISSSFRRAGQ
jgi:hypothetical protein